MKIFNLWQGKYEYRRKLQLVQWSAIPVVLLCYFLAFKKTVITASEYYKNKEAAVLSQNMDGNRKNFEARQNNISIWKKRYLMESTMADAKILSDLNAECVNLGLKFIDYKPLGTNKENVWTRCITVEGDFFPLLQLIYSIEQMKNYCRLTSIKYEAVYATDEIRVLQCTFFIQNIIS